MTIAFAGERGAFAELAALQYFGERRKRAAVPGFSDVFRGVAAGTFSHGVVPIENSLAGSIHQNYDALLESNLHIVGEVLLRIHQFLIANKGTSLRQVKTVYSHPAVFPQCRRYLGRLRGVAMVPVSNTAAAVKKILDEKIGYGAAIASFQAAIDFDMKVLAANIEDSKWNTTRFLVVASKARRPSGTAACKSSVVFSTRNIPGALYQCLGAFARRGIDLYKIESRPVQIRGSSFGYVFYLDFAGDIRGSVQRNAIRELNGITTFFRFLGSYAVDHARDPQYRHKKKITN